MRYGGVIFTAVQSDSLNVVRIELVVSALTPPRHLLDYVNPWCTTLARVKSQRNIGCRCNACTLPLMREFLLDTRAPPNFDTLVDFFNSLFKQFYTR